MNSTVSPDERIDSYHLGRAIRQVIREEREIPVLLEKVCGHLEKRLDLRHAWLILTDPHLKQNRYTQWTSNKEHKSYDQILESGYIPLCYNKAVEEKGAVILTDPASYCSNCPFCSFLDDNHVLFVPLIHQDTILGTFCASYHPYPDNTPLNKNLVNEMAEDVSYTIWSLKLQEENRKIVSLYTDVMDCSGEAVLTVNNKGIVHQFNPYAEWLFGLPADNVIGAPLQNLAQPALYEKWERLKETVRALQTYSHIELTLSRNHDIPLWGTIRAIYSREQNELFYNISLRPAADSAGTDQSKQQETTEIVRTLTAEDFQFGDLFNLKQMKTLQEDFARITGVSSIITSPEGIPLTEEVNFNPYCAKIRETAQGCRNCMQSDTLIDSEKDGPTIYRCTSGGLLDSGFPIKIGGKHIANWLVGQIRDKSLDTNYILDYAEKIGTDPDELLKLYRKVPAMSEKRFERVVYLLNTLAGQISTIAYQNMKLRRNIAERKDLARFIKRREEYLQGILKVAPVGIVVILANRFIQVNDRVCDITGYTREELVSQKNDILYLNNDEYKRVSQEEAAQIIIRGISKLETVWKHKSGRNLNIQISSSPLDMTDFSRGLVCRIQDITIEKQKEKERESLISAINQSQDSVIVTDNRGDIIYINPAYEEFTGYSASEILHQNLKDLTNRNLNEQICTELWETVSNGKNWFGRVENRKKDGSTYTEEASFSPVKDSDGNITNFVGVKRDITEKLEMEKENASLEDLYHQAQKEESIGRLAGGVAHDLNNLLSPILGYSELLMHDPDLDETKQNRINQIFEAGERARKLVKQLLTFSRKQNLEFQPVNLNTIINEFERLLSRTIRENIVIRIETEPGLPLINADSGKLEQIIMNLAVNAQDAMPRGGSLTIRTKKEDDCVILTITDTGCGIEKENQNKIFEPYFSTKGDKGTGLGLANVKSIVKQHKGWIQVSSEPDKGTEFTILLPAFKKLYSNSEQEYTAAREKASSLSILLVENDDQVRGVTSSILEQYGYTVLPTDSGEKALEFLEQYKGPLHLLLTDIVLPGIDGIDLHRKLSESHPGLKVLFMSGYLEVEQEEQIHTTANSDFIQKPLSINALIGKVQTFLDNPAQDSPSISLF